MMSTYGSILDRDRPKTEGAATTSTTVTNSTTNVENEPLLPLSDYNDSLHFPETPSKKSPWWSKLVFGWFEPLLALANRNKQLDPSDLLLLPLPVDCRTNPVMDAFDRCWEEEKARVLLLTTKKEEHDVSDGGDDREEKKKKKIQWWRTRRGQARPAKELQPSLVRAVCWAFGGEFMWAGVLKLIHDLCIFVGPQVLHGLIYFLRDETAPIRRGIFLTVAVTLSQLTMSMCLRHYFFKCFLVGLRMRTAVIIAVYRKALVLASAERQKRSAGEITNLLSVDSQRLQDLTTYGHAVWYSFLQIGLAIYFLWQQLGPSCLGGVLVIIIMMPVTKYVAKWMGSMQKRLMDAKDERVELNNEVLGSMKVIKLQAWEESFQRRISQLRDRELRQLFRYLMGSSLSIMLWSAVPLLVALATFATYTLLGNELDVASALTALALFEILRFPLFMLPQVINRFVEASISISRIKSFLLCDEHEPVGPGSLSDVGIRIDNASFIYDSKKPKFEGDESDVASRDMYNMKWEVQILRTQLADAEHRIRELMKADQGLFYDETSEDQDQSDILAPTSSSLISLRRINFECRRGEFIAVVGAVGSGKSSFLNSILGEVRLLPGGELAVRGRLAYFPQTPFIMNDTVKANVLFGHQGEKIDGSRYKSALWSCALSHDLKLLPSGDMTEIGEKGITLSGGQKARVALARAVYHDADIYLLDDPLAAVDSHVGKHIFRKCIIDELLLGKRSEDPTGKEGKNKKSTVILVTNALQYLSNPLVDRIVVLKNGAIHEVGSFRELSTSDSLFARFLSVLSTTGATAQDESVPELSVTSLSSASFGSLSALADVESKEFEPEVARVVLPRRSVDMSTAGSPRRESLRRIVSDGSRRSMKSDDDVSPLSTPLMTDELKEREKGHVNAKVYLAWAQAAGGTWVGIAIIIFYGGVEGINVLSKWWLTYWSEHGGEGKGSQLRFLAIYAAINMGAVLATFLRVVIVMFSGLKASKNLFSRMLDVVLRAPMSFFDTTPIGRIVNRFSKDIYTIDETLISILRSYLSTLFSVLSTIIVISGVTPMFTLCLIPIIVFYVMQQNYFTVAYRELKRIDSISRSPLYALLGETLDGVSTIRAFCAQSTLLRRMISMLDKQQNAWFLTCAAQCWLAVRLELAGTLIVTFACLCAVLQHGSKGGIETFAGLAGLSISFALSVTQSLNWSVRMASDMEANMVAVERIEQYSKIKSEAPRTVEKDSAVGDAWPENGEIRIRGARMRYRPGLPLVLKGLDIYIPANSKVGVVGRTGAGKSTLMVALLRIVELESGTILIDGVDISELGLAKLRSKIAVIPQDPVLFSGTVRTNLDPFDEYNDERLYEVLTRVGLYQAMEQNLSVIVSSTASKGQHLAVRALTDQVFEGGSNFSVGQRQLLVIARSLLRGAKIVIMDEATAAVDADTDARIQRILRTDFKEATCITIAHRLNTIMDSDYILVMDDGRAAEFDTPTTLLAKGGLFKDLVEVDLLQEND